MYREEWSSRQMNSNSPTKETSAKIFFKYSKDGKGVEIDPNLIANLPKQSQSVGK